MSSAEVYESLIVEVASLDRSALIERLSHFAGNMHLDFSPEFLAQCGTDQLRHFLLAALWHCQMKGQNA